MDAGPSDSDKGEEGAGRRGGCGDWHIWEVKRGQWTPGVYPSSSPAPGFSLLPLWICALAGQSRDPVTTADSIVIVVGHCLLCCACLYYVNVDISLQVLGDFFGPLRSRPFVEVTP